jgi:hypothetical protein
MKCQLKHFAVVEMTLSNFYELANLGQMYKNEKSLKEFYIK